MIISSLIRGFPVKKYKDDRWGIIATYWGFGLQIGRALITQNDYNKETGIIEGSILNHVSEHACAHTYTYDNQTGRKVVYMLR